MVEPDPPGTRSSSRNRRRRSRVAGLLANLWSEWRVELLIIAMVAFGIFLLVERMQIRQTLVDWLGRAVQALRDLGGSVLTGIADFVQNSTVSDLTGYVLLTVALAIVVWRARWRLMTMPRFTAPQCPQCGSSLHRIHRRRPDRVLGLVVPLRRYRCKDRDCHWQGLRVKRSRHE